MSALSQEIELAVATATQPLIESIQRLSDEVAQLREASPTPLLGCKEAAERLGITPQTLRKWVHEGKVVCQRRGKKMLFNDYDLITI